MMLDTAEQVKELATNVRRLSQWLAALTYIAAAAFFMECVWPHL